MIMLHMTLSMFAEACSSGKMAMRKRSAVRQHPKDTQARLLTSVTPAWYLNPMLVDARVD